MSLGFTTTLAPPLPSFSSTVQSANTQAPVKVSEVRASIGESPVPLQSPFPPYPHPLLFGNHMPVPENIAHPPIPNPANFQMNGDNPLMSTMENWENWRQFQQAAWAHNLDPHMLAFYHNAGYSMDFANGPRRKNATRETTSMLKAWLNEHKKNPYPTKGEKIMLAIITKMSLTQVSTWFANARRRLKKENKMTWSPRNRAEEDREHQAASSTHSGHNSDDEDEEGNSSAIGLPVGDPPIDIDEVSNDEDEDGEQPRISPGRESEFSIKPGTDVGSISPGEGGKETKPKIWSLADLARKEPRSDGDNLVTTPLSPSLIPHSMPHLEAPAAPPCLATLPPHHPGGGFHPGHIFPPNSGIFPSAAVAAAAVASGNKAFLPPPPGTAAAAAAAYIQAHPFLYPHYPSIGIHPFSAFTRPSFGPLDAREPPKLTPEVLLGMEKEIPGLDSRTDSSQFNTSKP